MDSTPTNRLFVAEASNIDNSDSYTRCGNFYSLGTILDCFPPVDLPVSAYCTAVPGKG